ncbi:hypothetical protein ABGB12_06490 [Actinocorallia sp. B10E7]|uniref:hypothetical protein n=1 Tax=Actinocorallia sp. B10E7 TaxID=3153558 RepID=UPI00325D3C83
MKWTCSHSVAQADEDDRQQVGGEPSGLLVGGHQPPQRGPHPQEHHQREGHRERGLPLALAGPGQGDHGGQRRPGQHVDHRGAGERQPAQPGAVHVPVGEDARQHGERRRRHRRAEEQHEREPVPAVHVVVGDGHGEERAEPERQQRRAEGHPGRHPAPAPDQPLVQLQPDDEHEQHQPDVRQGLQRRLDAGREQVLADQAAQQRRAEQDVGRDLPDDRRLADQPRPRPQQPGQGEDHHQVQQQQIDPEHQLFRWDS